MLLCSARLASAEIAIFSDSRHHNEPFYSAIETEIKRIKVTDKHFAIAIGTAGLEQFYQSASSTDVLIAIAITKQEYRAFFASRSSSDTPQKVRRTAIFMEPSPLALSTLATAIYGPHANIIVPYSISQNASPLTPGNHHQPTSIKRVPVKERRQWLRHINDVDCVIAIPDSGLYSRENIAAIARSLYRRRIGLIGFSYNLVQIGALAGLHTDPMSIAGQLVTTIEGFNASNTLRKPAYPDSYKVIVNETLAKTLGFYTLDEQILTSIVNQEYSKGEVQ